MNKLIKIKSLSSVDLAVNFENFYSLFSENTRGHEIEREIPESYIEKKARELSFYLKEGNSFLIGAFDNESLVGFLWAYKRVFFEENRLYINSLIIKDSYRGKNIGTSLIKELEKITLSNNVFVLDVSTATFKKDAIRFYEKLGFKSERIQLRKELK